MNRPLDFGEKLNGRSDEGQQVRDSLRGKPSSESPRKPPRGTLAIKTKPQKGTSQRFSEVFSETLSEEDLPLGVFGPVAPHRVAPLVLRPQVPATGARNLQKIAQSG